MKNGLVYLTYNSAPQVARNWASVLSVKHPLAIHIIDNASTDETPRLFNDAGIKFHPNSQNIYYSKAINQGIRALWDDDLEWIFLLNPDVGCPEEWDGLIVDELTPQSDVGIVGVRLVNHYGKVTHTGGIVGAPQLLYWPLSFTLQHGWSVLGQAAVCTTHFRHRTQECQQVEECAWVTFAAVALRKSMLKQVGLLDETYLLYCSDSNLCMRAWEAGWRVMYNPVTFQHEGSASVKMAGSEVQEVAQADIRRFALLEEPRWVQLATGKPHFMT